jgi:DNA-directed RNA polymerase specialized sigma subunit
MNYTFSELSKNVLLKLYSEFGFRAKEIGELVGITESAVLCRLIGCHNPLGLCRVVISR